jgi:alkyl sulfatase BDS1-like metallo-beta-lactamase superfamily hydrolase
VFADPDNTAARALQADAFEQLGYQSESATFRNAYLMGAQELRHGHPPRHPAARRGLVRVLPMDQLLATVAMRLKADEVGGLHAVVELVVTDVDERWRVELSNRALSYRRVPSVDDAAAALTATRDALSGVVAGEQTLDGALADGSVVLVGDRTAVDAVIGHLDEFLGGFPIVEP